MEPIKISLGNQQCYYTNSTSVNTLIQFYNNCKAYDNSTIHIDFDRVRWFDGNLCSILAALLYKLETENKLTYRIDYRQIEEKFDVLFYNHFLPIEYLNKPQSPKKTCISYRAFYPHEKDDFFSYLTDELLVNKGMPKFSEQTKEKLIDDLAEVAGNIQKHAETSYPFFVCGQYFPRKGTVNFTISDLGQGFFPKIKKAQPDVIKTDGDAILLALAGNSTKKDAPGGLGLKTLKGYFQESDGVMQIFTGKNGWISYGSRKSDVNGIVKFCSSCIGTWINLIFNKKHLT